MRDRLIPIALAISFVTLAAAAGTGDYVLVTPTERICAKDIESCELAREAIRKGWLQWAAPTANIWCEAMPGGRCFSDESNCIAGYNCR